LFCADTPFTLYGVYRTSVVRYATILRRGSPRAPAEELLQDKVLADAGRPADWAELRPWLGVRARARVTVRVTVRVRVRVRVSG
jgi:hypothetical protein